MMKDLINEIKEMDIDKLTKELKESGVKFTEKELK